MHEKRTEFTHTLNARTYKIRSGKGSWSSYTMISEHKCLSDSIVSGNDPGDGSAIK